jgi:RHS repeat-associated protein
MQAEVGTAVEILRRSPDLTDEEVYRALLRKGIERRLAARLVEFIPAAYCRVVLEPAGARFAGTFQRLRKGGTTTSPASLASEPVWVAALEYARGEITRGISLDDKLALAGRSAEFGVRYYSAGLGRFTSPDLISLTWDRLGNPSNTVNKYVYAANNPLKYTDPDGQDITVFYRVANGASSADFGHVFIVAYDPGGGPAEALDYFPKTDQAGQPLLQWHGLEYSGPGAVNTGNLSDRSNGGYASLTIQTTPEVTQKVQAFIRNFRGHVPAYRFPGGSTCVTACRAALELAGIRISAYSPGGLWNDLVKGFSPGCQCRLKIPQFSPIENSLLAPVQKSPGARRL